MRRIENSEQSLSDSVLEAPLAGRSHPVLFLSPHFDDVALSCGGMAAACADTEGAQIVTVFGGVPLAGTPETPFAHSLLMDWGAPSFAAAVRLRRAEDEDAARTLGASLVTLPFVDGAFRGASYKDWPALQTALVPTDADLPGQIADAVRATGLLTARTTLVGPLGVGRHVDHQAVFAALALLAPAVARVWLYEDFPYAVQQTDAVRSRLASVGLTNATSQALDIAPWLPTKIRAIECYASQVPVLFPDTPMPDAVRAYAEAVAGDNGAAERFWPLRG